MTGRNLGQTRDDGLADRVWMTGGVVCFNNGVLCMACRRWLGPRLVAMCLRLVVSRGCGCFDEEGVV